MSDNNNSALLPIHNSLVFRCHLPFFMAFITGVLAVCIICDLKVGGYDLYYQIRLGREIFDTHSIPAVNPFSILDNAHIDIQCPSYCVLVYLLFGDNISFNTFMTVKLILAVVLFLVTAYLTYKKEYGVEGIVFLAGTALILGSFSDIRARSVSYIILLVQSFILSRDWRDISSFKAVIFCSFFMANIHPSMLALLFIFEMPYALQHIISLKDGFSCRIMGALKLMLINMTAVAAGFINPMGYKAVFWMSMVPISAMRDHVTELHSLLECNPDCAGSLGFCLCFILIILNISFIISSGSFYDRLGDVILAVISLILAVVFVRNIYILPIGCLVTLYRFSSGRLACGRVRDAVVMAAIVFVTCLSLYLHATNEDYMPASVWDCTDGVLRYMESVDPGRDSRIITDSDIGSLLAYKGYRVSCTTMPEAEYKSMNGIADVREDVMFMPLAATCRAYDAEYIAVTHPIADTFREYTGLDDGRMFTPVYSNALYEVFEVNSLLL